MNRNWRKIWKVRKRICQDKAINAFKRSCITKCQTSFTSYTQEHLFAKRQEESKPSKVTLPDLSNTKEGKGLRSSQQLVKDKLSLSNQLHADEKGDLLDKLSAALFLPNSDHNDRNPNDSDKRIIPNSKEQTVPVADASTSNILGINKGNHTIFTHILKE